ncbi:transcription repressor NadR [uncultured Anaerococcus sp.]|uniref:transcription repressor NadR n=1 Tax=uncultured Anaerococcus sp. TaxID=293428 RepID=UPI0025EC9C35|nr:transcription repressor NadR [uncultured Anaerococcus sp.]
MKVNERRIEIIKILQDSKKPVSGKDLAEKFDLSRQVIVKDIGILKAKGVEILSTNRGYKLKEKEDCERIVRVKHDKKAIGEELNILVDRNITIKDVFICHRVYGTIKKDLDISSRNGVNIFLENLETDAPLLKLTSGIHYHTLIAKNPSDMEKGLKILRERKYLIE